MIFACPRLPFPYGLKVPFYRAYVNILCSFNLEHWLLILTLSIVRLWVQVKFIPVFCCIVSLVVDLGKIHPAPTSA